MINPGQRDAHLSPLDQIRLAEADVTRKIAKVREDHERILTNAQTQAKEMVVAAEESGQREGETQYREIIFEAEEEAKAILAGAKHQATALRRKGNRHMDTAVRQVVNIVTGMDRGEGS